MSKDKLDISIDELDEELSEPEDDTGLNELDFDGYYLDNTTSDQEQDMEDYYNLVESGVDMSDGDPFDGFQIHNIDDQEEIEIH